MRTLTFSLALLAFGLMACSDDSGPPTPVPWPDTGPATDVVEDVDEPPDVVDEDVTSTPEVTPTDIEVDTHVGEDTAPDQIRPPTDTTPEVDTGPPPVCTVDEDCTDGNPCTVGTCEDNRCFFQLKNCRPPDALECDDWYCNPVTGDCEVRENGRCEHLCVANPDICDDFNPCTTHSCDPARGCIYELAEGPCDNQNPCTTNDRCVADPSGETVAICQAGDLVTCDDDDPCTINWCDPTYPPGAQCRQIELIGLDDCEVIPCPGGEDDECPVIPNPCIEYLCDPDQNVCVSHFTDNPCDDNNPCTTNDTCQEGVCVGGPPPDCDDGDFCTQNACIPEQGGCVNTPLPDCREPCVTVADCPTTDNQCLQPVCTPAGLCHNIVLTGPCDNSNPCTIDDFCRDGRCMAGPPLDCDDGNFCTRNYCDPEVPDGCVTEEIPGCDEEIRECVTGADCDDGDPCTINSCLTLLDPTVCTTVPRPFCSCNPNRPDGGHSDCDDGDPCTDSFCEPNTDQDLPYEGLCTPPEFNPERCCEEVCDPEDNTCDDGDKCTLNLCEPGASGTGPVIYCCTYPHRGWPCGEPCTDLGEVSAQCDDGDDCTVNICGEDGTCDPPLEDPQLCQCRPGTVAEDCAHLEDGNICTDIECIDRQCKITYNNKACDDFDACTVDTFCTEGECVGEPRDCDDGEFCTDDFCDSETGCYWVWDYEREGCSDQRCITDGECQDGNPCTVGRCIEEICQFLDINEVEGYDTPLCYSLPCSEESQCDDGNPCTTNTCVRFGIGGVPLPADERVCIHEIIDDCTPDAALGCSQATDCESIACDPEYGDAFCTYSDCVAHHCDPQVGCRFLPTTECDFERECAPETAHLDCWDGDPCTLDVCVDGLCDNSQMPYDPGDNMWLFCNPCTNDLPCDPTDQPWYSENTCVEYHCRQFPPLHPSAEAAGQGVCWAELPELPFDTDPNLWDSCEYCSPTEPCDPTEQSFFAGVPCAGHFCRPLGEGFGDQGICWAELPDYDPNDNLWDSCEPCADVSQCDPTDQAFFIDNPCSAFDCRQIPLPSSPDGATVGICWAELDDDLYPNLCEDYDLCTANVCLPEGGCANVEWYADCRLCGSDGDCDDIDRCTVGECVDDGFRCEYTEIEDCIPCLSHEDCPPDDGCQMYNCERGQCFQLLISPEFEEAIGECAPQACGADTPCDDGDPTTLGKCLTGSNACISVPAGCPNDFDCVFQRTSPCESLPECVDGVCQPTGTIPGCIEIPCDHSSDCLHGQTGARVFDLCLDGLCVTLLGNEACSRDADCFSWDDEHGEFDPCARTVCDPGGYCRQTALGDYARCSADFCESDADCAPRTMFPEDSREYSFCLTTPDGEYRCYDWPCAQGYCAVGKNVCLYFDGPCRHCENDADCLDGDPCTESTCEAGACVQTPIPDCAPVPCDEDNPCGNEDPCEIGVCLESGCYWVPNPVCDFWLR